MRHLLRPIFCIRKQVLDDEDLAERALGLSAGFAWSRCADLVAVYTDYGITPGMESGMVFARAHGILVQERSLKGRHLP